MLYSACAPRQEPPTPTTKLTNPQNCPIELGYYDFRPYMGREPAGGWPDGTLLGYDPVKCEWIFAGGKPPVITGFPFLGSPTIPGCTFQLPGATYCGTPLKEETHDENAV